ncbi:MAG: lipid A export permease/ATP-binding protein MsbA [Desulfobacteraceae bacterium]|nr:lipid A export permease/ATP-binding protein MsbA [Desulfobacteraceae bacterium]
MIAFKRLLAFTKGYWLRITIAALASMAVGGMDGAFAYFISPLLKKIFQTQDLTIFKFLPLGIVAIFTLRGLSRYLNDYFMRTATQLVVQDIRNLLYARNMAMGLRFFGSQSTGTLMSRVLNDVIVMQEGMISLILGVFRDGISAAALLGVIFYRNWQLALISFLVIPLTVYPAQKIGKRLKSISRQSQEKMGDIASILQETFSGIKVIKAFSLEQRSIEKFRETNLGYYVFMRKSIKYGNLSTPIMEFITSLGIAAVVWFGGIKVMSGQMSAADFFSFITAMALVYSPIKKLNSSFNDFQRCLGAAERVFEVIDKKPEIVDAPDALPLDLVQGDVDFRNVSFRFGDAWVLRNITLSARRGEIVALVGPSGGGKTTLVSLIPRFYDVTEGVVQVDGHDVRSVKLETLMSQIALVDQETTLFNDTLANNIRYGKPGASDVEVQAAAQAAFAHDFISEMPDGYATNIGDRGVRLSGGQRQRICIARALLKDTPILILDEATSALDTESEQMVQNALNNLMQNRTTFVIAHRLSTILNADRILVLDKGEIVEQGSHEELVSRDGLYKKLYSMQFKNTETETGAD